MSIKEEVSQCPLGGMFHTPSFMALHAPEESRLAQALQDMTLNFENVSEELSAAENELQRVEAERDRLEAQLAEARAEMEWLGDYLFSLTGDLWPQNETTAELLYRLFRNGRDDMIEAINLEIRGRRKALAGEEG